MRILIFIIALSVALPVFGQRRTREEEDTENMVPVFVEGVIYSLPQTGIRIHVQASRTDFAPGPYARFANQLLGIDGVKTQAGTQWEIEKVWFETYSEPDPEQVYKALGDNASLINLTPDGCLAGINFPSNIVEQEKVTTNPVAYPSGGSNFQFFNLTDMPFYSAGDSTNNFRPTRLSIEQKAAEAATRIIECRRMRFETATGYLDVLPPDGKAYEESIKQLQELEKEYLSLFVGKTHTESLHFSFEFVPESNINNGVVVFRFSEENGILEKTDLTGKPIMIEFTKNAGLANNYDKLKASENPNAGESGVFYRQPGMAEVKLIYELKTIVTTNMPVAQFGVTAPVPELYLNGFYSLEFHPETGAIKSIIQK